MGIFNNKDFYPTPAEVAEIMCSKIDIANKVVLEPSMGKGDLVDVIRKHHPKQIIGCEKSQELLDISAKKVDMVVCNDFLNIDSTKVSHIDCIIANPPFSNGDEHILKMWEIAPEGCQIVCLLNEETINNLYTRNRTILNEVIKFNGSYIRLGNVFSDAERSTNVDVILVILNKPIVNEGNFDAYFDMGDMGEGGDFDNGVMQFNEVRNIVNRYVGALKSFDNVIKAQNEMNSLIAPLMTAEHRIKFTASCERYHTLTFDAFRSELQKSSWVTVFNKLGADKYMTTSLKAQLNKFVEQQKNVPFTMGNIYKMIEMVVGTHGNRMEKVILEVFDWLTEHTFDNRFVHEGWKTNSEYIVNKKFIAPRSGVEMGFNGFPAVRWTENQRMDDLMKALHYIQGEKWTDEDSFYRFYSSHGELVQSKVVPIGTERNPEMEYMGAKSEGKACLLEYKEEPDYSYRVSNDWNPKIHRFKEYGKWYDWKYLRIKVFKKGTLHAEFKDDVLWSKFNQLAAKFKGFQLASKFTGDFRSKGNGVEKFN